MYARRRGFRVAKKSDSKGNGSVIKNQTISCNRWRKSTANKYTKRINCPVHLCAILRDNCMWEVSNIIEQHNHDLNRTMSKFMLAHRSINSNVKGN